MRRLTFASMLRTKRVPCGLMLWLLVLASGARQAHSADTIDDLSNGLVGWTVQTTRGSLPVVNEVIANPNGDPVIEIAAQGNGALFANPPWTILTSSLAGAVGDFDIAVSFAGSAGMNGVHSFGLVFGFQDAQNYYIAHVFPGFGGSAFRLEKVSSGAATPVFSGSTGNHNVGFTWSKGNDNALVTPDALRIRRVGSTFDAFAADSSGGGWLSFSQSTWTDNSFPATPSLVGFGERFDGTVQTTGARFAVFGSGAAGVASVLASTDLSLALSSLNNPPTAVAGSDQPIRAGDTVNLNGGASFDDNTASAALDYSWSFFSKPVGSTATLTDANTATPSFIADLVGTYIVELVVTDEGGLASDPPDQVEISSDNLAPTAVATVDFSLAIIDQDANFDGSSSTDPELDPLTYEWTITAAPAGSTAVLVGANTATPSLTPDLEGDYDITLTVSDFLGEGTPDTVEITATTASGFAEIQIIAAGDLVEGLSPSQVKTKGNQRAFGNFLRQAVRKLQNGQVEDAIDKLGKALDRTDGCIFNGEPDGNGPGMDWVTDCDAQTAVYGFITAAIMAIEL